MCLVLKATGCCAGCVHLSPPACMACCVARCAHRSRLVQWLGICVGALIRVHLCGDLCSSAWCVVIGCCLASSNSLAPAQVHQSPALAEADDMYPAAACLQLHGGCGCGCSCQTAVALALAPALAVLPPLWLVRPAAEKTSVSCLVAWCSNGRARGRGYCCVLHYTRCASVRCCRRVRRAV